jgi:hypothetical protein
MMEN